MKKVISIVAAIILTYSSLFTFMCHAAVDACNTCAFGPDPAEPEITEAEFPFTIVYELNGERIVYEDAIVCKYEGIFCDTGRGKYRWWSKDYKNGTPILDEYDNGEYVFFSFGAMPSELMGDNEYPTYSYISYSTKDKAEVLYYEYCGKDKLPFYNEDTGTFESKEKDIWLPMDITDEELLELGIVIISYEIAPPIENTFN